MPQILDATAGNRTIWTVKDDPRVLFIDIEPDLDIPADRLLDCTNTQLPDKSLHTIIFDPPHEYGHGLNSSLHSTPSRKIHDEKWPAYIRKGSPRYYGGDKYQSKTELMVFLYKAAKEFSRILMDDGILLLKWGQRYSYLDSILPLFDGFKEVMRTQRYEGKSVRGCVWVLLMKNNQSSFCTNNEVKP